MFDYKYDLLASEPRYVALTIRSLAILVVNGTTATRFNQTSILPKSRPRCRSRTTQEESRSGEKAVVVYTTVTPLSTHYVTAVTIATSITSVVVTVL